MVKTTVKSLKYATMFSVYFGTKSTESDTNTATVFIHSCMVIAMHKAKQSRFIVSHHPLPQFCGRAVPRSLTAQHKASQSHHRLAIVCTGVTPQIVHTVTWNHQRSADRQTKDIFTTLQLRRLVAQHVHTQF